jgi:hypothetical protein
MFTSFSGAWGPTSSLTALGPHPQRQQLDSLRSLAAADGSSRVPAGSLALSLSKGYARLRAVIS